MSGTAVVVGAGIAGTAAALELARSGISVRVVRGAPGASELSNGALDWASWESAEPQTEAPRGTALEDVSSILRALGGYALDDRPSVLATTAGILRTAAGRDRGLLDMRDLSSGEVLLPRAPRAGWDADALARMLTASPLAVARDLSFASVDATILRFADERTLPDATMATRHDDAARLTWLQERLAPLVRSYLDAKALLLPPWLGSSQERASALSQKVGLPCGEIAVGLAGPAGFRFAAARERAFSRANVELVQEFASALDDDAGGVRVTLESGVVLTADAAVLATGGLIGGGLVYQPSEAAVATELPSTMRPFLRATLSSAPVGISGQVLETPGSLFGVAPETLAWPYEEDGALERAGVLADGSGRIIGRARLTAAGEIVADRPRTWLEGARGGVAAARMLLTTAFGVAANRG